MSDTGFTYAVICTVAQILSHVAMGFCLERLLTERDDRKYRRKRITIWIVSGSVIIGVKCLVSLPFFYISIVTPIAMPVFTLFFLKYFYQNKWPVKLFHIAMLVIQNLLADIISQSILGYPIGNEAWELPFRNRIYAESCIMIAAISIMLNIIYTVIALKIWNKKRAKTSPVWMAVLLFFVLMFFSTFVIRDTASMTGEGARSYFIFCCILTIMEFAALMLFLSQSERKEAQEEKQRTLEEVKKLRHIMELEKLHYEQIEARREEMAKIRHDYNNVITSVMYLIENGRTDEAEEIMKDLARRISQTKE